MRRTGGSVWWRADGRVKNVTDIKNECGKLLGRVRSPLCNCMFLMSWWGWGREGLS